MPAQSRNILKQYFETGDFPTQQQFYDLIDSMLLAGEVSMGDIVDLVATLQGKAEKSAFDAHVQGIRVVFAGNGNYVIPAGYILYMMIVEPSADANISIGNAAGLDDISPALPMSAANGEVISQMFYAKGGNRTIYFNGVPAGTAIIFFQRLVKTA